MPAMVARFAAPGKTRGLVADSRDITYTLGHERARRNRAPWTADEIVGREDRAQPGLDLLDVPNPHDDCRAAAHSEAWRKRMAASDSHQEREGAFREV